MAPPNSSSPSLPSRSHLFTPIEEGNESEETEMERHRLPGSSSSTTTTISATPSYTHKPTPLHEPGKKHRRATAETSSSSTAVSCNNCRPTTREKHSVMVVPVDSKHPHSLSSTSASPSPNNNNLFRSFITTLSRRSPKPDPTPSPAPESSTSSNTWQATVSELSHKLLQATRKRDEAILESSRLKYSMTELEKKLNRLEIYCHSLKSGLDMCNQASQSPGNGFGLGSGSGLVAIVPQGAKVGNTCDFVVKYFLGSVSEARTSVRLLSRALTSQLKLMGIKVLERLCTILRSYDIKLVASSCYNNNNSSRTLQLYLEALLSATFYEDFETAGFEKNSANRVLNPMERSEVNFAAFKGLKDLAWEEVLDKGTKHFSEKFSKFCDRKMSEIVAMLGWNRAWPEQLLQAFFGASKSVWLVHLLANSVHPCLTIFRVDKGVRFDPVYMEDMGGDKAKKLIPTMIRIMVAPGFYVNDNVVKCKVLCRYHNSSYSDYTANDG